LEPEIRNWVEQLPTAKFATAAFYIDLLAERGPLIGEPYTRQLDGKLRELRFHLDRQRGASDVLDSSRAADCASDGVC
jgi:hypothetical protein